MKVIMNTQAKTSKLYEESMKFLTVISLGLAVALILGHSDHAQAQGVIPGQSNDEIETMTQAKIFCFVNK